jgi:hypothetical protein
MSTTPSATLAPGAPHISFTRRHRWKIILIGLLVLVVGIAALYTWATLSFTYSSGERVGYVQKLSRKGWICPTWEGELAMTPVPGAAPQIFEFSVREEGVAKQIQELQGKKIALQYAQKKGVPTRCFGETEYFVTFARAVGQ